MWRALTRHDQAAAVSSITLFEIARHGLMGRLDRSVAETIVQRPVFAYDQASVDPTDALSRAARITHGMGLPVADAMVAASLEHVGCDTLYTSDSDFEAYDGDMEVGFL